jgi:hypothetical protein
MKRVFLYACLSFVAGLLVGGGVLISYMKERLNRSESVSASLAADSYLSALAPLRSGDTNAAIRRLHIFLDFQILNLTAMPQTEIVTSTLGRVKYYRNLFPYTSIGSNTESILSDVRTK